MKCNCNARNGAPCAPYCQSRWDVAERRRYALLQAAAALHALTLDKCGYSIEGSVECAEALLDEIEKREAQS